ncbi:hypothetical protein ACTXT7_004101 [Hymenolepis weldensis]
MSDSLSTLFKRPNQTLISSIHMEKTFHFIAGDILETHEDVRQDVVLTSQDFRSSFHTLSSQTQIK